LYEALERRFPGPESAQLDSDDSGLPSLTLPENGPGNYERQSARIYYFLGLIAKGRTTNAVVVARKFEKEGEVYFPGEVIRQMERAGFTTELNNFFHELLRQNPELPFWDEYVQVAAHAGQTAEMVTLVRAAASQSSLSKGQRTRLQQTLCKALLANDEVEAGVNELRSLVRSAEQQNSSRRNYSIESAGDLSLQLARIGQLLNRTNWVEEGIAAARNDLLRSENPEDSYGGPRTVFSLASFLQKNGRGAEAESVLASALAKEAQNARTAGAGRRQTGTCPALLGALLRVYHEAGRHEDVLTLLDHAPFWGAKDLAQAQMQSLNFEDSSSDYYEKHVSTPLGYYAAAALAKTGHPTGARKLLDPLFDQSPGCDRLYELLLALDDERAPAELDAIFSRDQFEERPLIWKAHWLRLHQRLEEAEQVARKAISIDPTDGEEGPGDRLRAYAELAEIRAARGDRKEAETLRGAVQAVHEAELADQFHAAGLLKRAIDLYTDSLNKFADAYCIHARLAVQLSDLGKHEEAAEHYRRAYELMPDSFGRVESHCFGCERAFDGERAQGIAEKVFIQLAQKTPAKPQIHYLLGYLREEQSRYQEALDSYRTAVKLDPDYLNAWVKMQSVDEHVYVSPAERDAVVFNILRLDPMHHRLTPSFEVVSDLAALWNQVAALEKKKPLRPDSLYPLAASEAELERQAASGASRQELYMEYQSQMMERDAAITPGRAVSQNGFIQAALSFFGSRSALFGDE
jgi:tetratricopeptide (TPR) repeat protein